jgi:AraC-like DNA-binding protein
MPRTQIQRREATTLPPGIPTYSLRHGFYCHPADAEPVASLHDDWDLFWVVRGEATWRHSNGRSTVVGSDEFFLQPPFVATTLHESRPQLEVHYCHFSFRSAPARGTAEVKAHLSGSPVAVPVHFTRAEAPEVWRAYRALAASDYSPSAPSWRLESALITLVSELAAFARSATARMPLQLNPEPLPDRRLAAMVARIERDPTHAWRVTDLARDIGISPGHLHALFNGTYKMSVKRYLVHARLRKAISLLNAGKQSIRAISEACGFSSQHFFSRQFKAVFGLSPAAFRARPVLA